MKHLLDSRLLQRPVTVSVIGAGGTGSQMLMGLAQLHHAMVSLGHPGGLAVEVIDGDEVSPSNVGRQMFYPSDVGQKKALVLVNRINVAMGTRWSAKCSMLESQDTLRADIVIGCVDTREARKTIKEAGEVGRAGYWLDAGNRQHDGQVILGEFINPAKDTGRIRLPNIADLYPETCDPELDGEDSGPSCSLAEALEKQSLFINRGVSLYALNLLFELFRYGGLDHHGVFLNLKNGRSSSLAVDPEAWARFGYKVRKPRKPRAKKLATQNTR